MLKRVFILIGLLAGVIVVSRAQDAAPEIPEREIYTVLAVGEGVFEPGLWLASASEKGYLTTAEWRADSIGALAFLNYLHFDGGITPEEIQATFNRAWFEATFANYQSWQEVSNCQIEDVRLHEFSFINDNLKYDMLYWIEPISETRVQTLFLTFPEDSRELMDEYAAELYPDAIVCAG